MKLIVKVNLVLVLIFVIGFLTTGYVSRDLLQRNATEEIQENARIIMEAAMAIRAYTNTEIVPLLKTQMKYSFVPQSIPAYSAYRYFVQLRKKFPDYSYREATLNPTNPAVRATDWEADIIRYFRDSPQQTELLGERATPNGRVLYIARPMRLKDPSCLECHSTPENAPRTMIELYGSVNGFGWKLNDLQTAQIVSAPMQLPIARANHVFKVFMASLSLVLVIIFLAVNAMLTLLVIRPVKRLSKAADEVSLGNMEVPEFQSKGKDEIAGLSESFNRMRKSLTRAMKMLDTEAS